MKRFIYEQFEEFQLSMVACVRTPTRCHIDLACNTSYHFAASRTVFPRVSPYLYPGPFAPFGTRHVVLSGLNGSNDLS